MPRLYDRFFKFYFQAIDHSHCVQRGFDISKCNYKCVGHLHFDQDEIDSNATCKLILVLSVSDTLLGIVAQPLFTIEFYNANCLVATTCLFVSAFLNHVSGYTIAMIGIDCYIRIKYFVNFKSIWTTRVVLTLSCIGYIFALIQALVITTGLLLRKEEVAKRIYIAIDSTIIALVILLQLQTMKTSKALHNESIISTSERIDKKILKLSIRIMTFLCFLLCYLLLSSMFYVKYFKSS